MVRVLVGHEIWVPTNATNCLSWFGNPGYGGWKIPKERIYGRVGVIDAGVGEDISFSEDLIFKLGAHVVAIDPTTKAANFLNEKKNPSIDFINHALSEKSGKAIFYLPSNENHVSGSLISENHLRGGREIEVDLTCLSVAIERLPRFDTLIVKMDIEGAEFDLLASEDFLLCSKYIDILCIEFHHRWPHYGLECLRRALGKLRELGFICVWRNSETNEEFTFVLANK
ncbi:MAG: FkbM family methyltransferase [Deltaproteobacteria bacterium]|nr:FkbM family methyltransferase [Deltaproteobacteria bacterium]